ncbi:retrovirus-related Pol polyprotein from transposon 412 [Trichonephila clavipes]|nr:retrovirus-related Pol polyprotein from transposon 412 [Trichonephila clavipes]
MKTRLQKTRESLQEYASEVERLANLAFSDHPAIVRNNLFTVFRGRPEGGGSPEGFAENRKFRFGVIDYPDPGSLKAGVLIASSVVDLSNSVIPVRIANISDRTRTIQIGENSRASLSLFSKTSEDFGRTRLTKHRIDTGDHPPIKQHPRRLPFAKQEEVQKLIKDMKDNVIEPSSSPWASPIVLVRKKEGSTRFCVNYRWLNDVTKKDSYPLPRIDDTLETLPGNT